MKKPEVMNIEERKLGLISWITQIGNEEVIEKIEQLKGEESWFNSLPKDVQQAIKESQAQGEEGIFLDTKAQIEKLKNLI